MIRIITIAITGQTGLWESFKKDLHVAVTDHLNLTIFMASMVIEHNITFSN